MPESHGRDLAKKSGIALVTAGVLGVGMFELGEHVQPFDTDASRADVVACGEAITGLGSSALAGIDEANLPVACDGYKRKFPYVRTERYTHGMATQNFQHLLAHLRCTICHLRLTFGLSNSQ